MEATFPVVRTGVTAPRTRRNEIISKLMDDLDFAMIYNGGSANAFRSRLEALSDSTIELIGETSNWILEHGFSRYELLHSLVALSNEQTIREVMFHRPHFTEQTETREAVKMINGVHRLGIFNKTVGLDRLSGRALDIAKAILNVTAAMKEFADSNTLIDEMGDEMDEDVLYLFNLDLVDVIVAAPDKAPQMVEFIKRYGNDDEEHMLSYIQNHQALRDGTL